KMSSGPPSLVEACAEVSRAFSLNADPRLLANAIDSQGVYEKEVAEGRIEKYKGNVLERHRTTGERRVEQLSQSIEALKNARDIHRGLYIADGLIMAKKYIREPQRLPLGMEKEPPAIPPKRGFVSTQQLTNAGSRSPHFQRRSASRSRVRSELTGDMGSPYSTASTALASSLTPSSITPFARPFGSSFNAAVAARDAAPKLPARTRSNLLSMESGATMRSPLELERDRTFTTHASYFSPSSTVSATNRLYDEQLRHSASSSPVSQISSSTAPTVVHVPPSATAATLRAAGIVCGRAAGANEVSDDVLAQCLVKAFNGFQSSYCRLSDGVFRMSAGCAISGSKRGRVLRLLQMASHAHAMNMSSAQGSDLMTEAFIVGIQETRRRFTQDVIELEKQRGANLTTRSLDFAVTGKWELALARVASLAALLRQPQMKGMTILHELYLHYTSLANTRIMEETVVVSLLDSVMFVFSNLLRQWLLDGTLNVHNTEFLIKERAGHGGEQGEAAMVKSWQTRFELDRKLLPAFLDRNLPKMILSVGKCARLLAGEDLDDQLAHHRTRVANLDLTRLYRLDGNERAGIGKELGTMERSICGLVVERLLTRDQLKEHLRAIHHIFLCLNERYATHLFEAIDSMCRDVQSISSTRTQYAAAQAFISAAKTAALFFPFKLPVDAAAKESSSDTALCSARSARDRSRVTVTPTYKAPRLAAIVLGKSAVEHYQSLFHTIWPVYSTRLALSEARNELLFISDASRRLGKGTSASLRAFQLAMATAGSFFDNLIRYFIQGVISTFQITVYSNQLVARLDRAGSVEECIKHHKGFLLSMADHVGVTLTGDKRGPSKLTSSLHNTRGVLLEEASSLLDLFWTWTREAEREQLLRKTKSEEMEMGADAASTTLLEFEKIEEKIRREEAEKRQVASSTKILAIFDRFSMQMKAYIDLYETEGKKNEMSKLLLSMKLKKRKEEEAPTTTKPPRELKWTRA
ncbi:hypothetical protein PENTCL1PPCAC_10145, partial [Pristionchus entomophagus]